MKRKGIEQLLNRNRVSLKTIPFYWDVIATTSSETFIVQCTLEINQDQVDRLYTSLEEAIQHFGD